MINIALMASGNGSNAEALISKSRSIENVSIKMVITDVPSAGVVNRCERLKQPCSVISSSEFQSRLEHENQILKCLFEIEADWIFLCGYMKILSPHFLGIWSLYHHDACQVVNIHPSLLPDLPGVRSLERAWERDISSTGVTLHYVDEGVDTGRIIDQKKLKIDRGDSFEVFVKKMHLLEHEIYENFLVSLAKGSPRTFHYTKDV